MLHNIYRENAVNCVLKRRLAAVGPFSRNKSHIQFLLFKKQNASLSFVSQVLVFSCCTFDTELCLTYSKCPFIALDETVLIVEKLHH